MTLFKKTLFTTLLALTTACSWAAEGDIKGMVYDEADKCYYRLIEDADGNAVKNTEYGYVLMHTIDIVDDGMVSALGTKVGKNSYLRGFGNTSITYDTYTDFTLDSRFSINGKSASARMAYSPTYGIGMGAGYSGTYTVGYKATRSNQNDIVEFYGFTGGVITDNFQDLPDTSNPVTVCCSTVTKDCTGTSTTISSSTTDGAGYSIIKGVKYYARITNTKDEKEFRELTVGETGLATFATGVPYEFVTCQDYIEVYIAKSYENGAVNLQRVYSMTASSSAQAGYLLRSKNGGAVTAKAYRIASATAEAPETNLFKYWGNSSGSKIEQTEVVDDITYTNFYLTNKTADGTVPVGFYKVGAEGQEQGSSNKAYLSIPNYSSNSNVKMMTLIFGEDDNAPTAVIPIARGNAPKATDTAVYNILGQKVNANSKGIVIINGKKYFNK